MNHDPHRPTYHFLPPSNWLNDPNGLIQWHGQYHLFYQYNPHAPYWGPMHWGHAVSEDLVHWRHLPIALTPTPGTADADGCWSGYAVDHDGVPTLIYTGLRGDTQLPCLATSLDDSLITWQKHDQPIIAGPPEGLDVPGFRDHSVWRDGEWWYQVIGSGIRDVGGAALLYRSLDLRHWQYLHPLLVGDGATTGEMWECPDFFPLGDKHVLILSPIPLRKAIYFIGDYREHRFTPTYQGVLDHGGHFYAPLTMRSDDGRRLLFSWLWEGRSEEAFRAAGWAGVISLPRILELGPDGRLLQRPAPELEILRQSPRHWRDIKVGQEAADLLTGLQGDSLEILAEFDMGDAAVAGLKVRCSPDGAEQTLIAYDRAAGRLEIDRQQSSLDPESGRDTFSAPLALAEGQRLRLHLFLDRSVLELFANGHTCLASRIYPTRPDSLGLDLFAQGGQARLRSLTAWPIDSI